MGKITLKGVILMEAIDAKIQNVLILGNGFDLAHELPTRYIDFMDFCDVIKSIFDKDRDFDKRISKKEKMNLFIKDILTNLNDIHKNSNSADEKDFNDEYFAAKEIYDCIYNNIWYKYFMELCAEKKIKGENWIDFESEMSFIIQLIDINTHSLLFECYDILDKIKLVDESQKFKIEIFKNVVFYNYNTRKIMKDFREDLYEHLEQLIRSLELYLSCFAGKLPINTKSLEIEKFNPDFIMNFNYTNTYCRIYNRNKKIFYVHGQCDGKRMSENNNMVLGIDEYWSKEKQDSNVNFTIFKKFAQRIRKMTGSENYSCMQRIKSHYKEKISRPTHHQFHEMVSSVYIFGHSLDITDKDILFEFLSSDATSVTIFCKDKSTQGELIAKVIEIIGEECLRKKAFHNPSKLKFLIQKDMVPIEEEEPLTSGAAT